MKNLIRYSLILSLILAAVACGNKKTEAPTPTPGELVFNKNCKVCHAQGISGAPIIGNKVMWENRIKQGIPTLLEHATSGYGLMPAKGGNTDLADEDVEKAIRYMLSKVQ